VVLRIVVRVLWILVFCGVLISYNTVFVVLVYIIRRFCDFDSCRFLVYTG